MSKLPTFGVVYKRFTDWGGVMNKQGNSTLFEDPFECGFRWALPDARNRRFAFDRGSLTASVSCLSTPCFTHTLEITCPNRAGDPSHAVRKLQMVPCLVRRLRGVVRNTHEGPNRTICDQWADGRRSGEALLAGVQVKSRSAHS